MASTIRPVPTRCPWCGTDPSYVAYHDDEWGVPVHDDRHLFEMLTLEGAQAGLSWKTILDKRSGYREAFHGFDPVAVADFAPGDVDRLMNDGGIVRNRLKIESAITNARRLLDAQRAYGSFDSYIWGFVGSRPLQNTWASMSAIPSSSEQSVAMSRSLKHLGFAFVGPTTCYAFMQAVGMVNDHLVGCYRHKEIRKLGA